MSKEFIAEAAQRASGDDMPLWKVQRDRARAEQAEIADAATLKQAAASERRTELMSNNVGATFQERIRPFGGADAADKVAKEVIKKTVSPKMEALREETFKLRVGTGLAEVKPHDNGLGETAEVRSRLETTLQDVREQKAEEAARDEAKKAAYEEMASTSKEAWKAFPASEPEPSPKKAEWTGDAPVSDIVAEGRRSKEDILRDPTPNRLTNNPSTK